MNEDLTIVELANIIKFYCELYVEESDPRRKKLWHRSLSLYIEEAQKNWFNVEQAFTT